MASSFDTETEETDFENLAGLAENIVYRLPGCSDLMVRKTIQDVYRDFCRRSCCLHGRRHFEISEGEREVSCAPMFGGLVDCITDVVVDRRHLHEGDFRSNGGRVELSRKFVPSKDVRRKVEIAFVEIPKMNSEMVPSWFIQKHGEAIVSGVLARLMAMTGRAWTDAQQASDERIRYENAVNGERIAFYSRSGNGTLGSAIDTSDMI